MKHLGYASKKKTFFKIQGNTEINIDCAIVTLYKTIDDTWYGPVSLRITFILDDLNLKIYF